MDSLPVIFDISSDDDEFCCDEPEGDDYNWLSEVLKSVNGTPADNSNDVVVVSEVNHRKRAKLSKPVGNDFDEDCVILDGDPEKSGRVVNEPQNGSDELLIVGEKGQVACRDFPHSRQHCAKFPFSSTPHETHCSLCHCYVCDSIAPCKYWGKGRSDFDHCHATEKEEKWKLRRENRQQGKRAPPSVPKLPYVSHSRSQPQLNQDSQMNQNRQFNQVPQHNNVQPSTIISSTSNPVIQNHMRRFNQLPQHDNVQPSTIIRSTSNPVIQNHTSRPLGIRACTPVASNPIMQNQTSRPTGIRAFTPSASNPVIRPCTPSASKPVIRNQPPRPTVIRACTPSASNPVTQNQVSRLNVIRPCTSSTSNLSIQNQVSKCTVVRACTPPTHIGTPMVITHSGDYPAQQILAINRTQPHLVSQQPVSSGNKDSTQKERDQNIGNPDAKYIPSQRTCQRSPSVGGALPTNNPGNNYSYSDNHAHLLQQSKARSRPSAQQTLNDRSGWLGTSTSMNPRSGTCQGQDFSQTSGGNMYFKTVPSKTQVRSQPITQSNASQNGRDPSFSASQIQGKQQPPVDNSPLPAASTNQSLPNFDFENWLLNSEPLQDGLTDEVFDFESWLLGNKQVP